VGGGVLDEGGARRCARVTRVNETPGEDRRARGAQTRRRPDLRANGRPTTESEAGTASSARHERAIDIATAVLLALAAVASAWSGYQSARWSGIQAIAFSEANAARLESTRASTRAGQLSEIDVGMFIAWVTAYSERNEELEAFLFDRFRPPMRTAVDAWIATRPLVSADAPPSPFAMEEYRLPEQEEAERLQTEATAAVERAKEANQRSDNYVLAVVLFASALFFAGISTKLSREETRLAVLVLGWLVLLGAAGWVATFPVTVAV